VLGIKHSQRVLNRLSNVQALKMFISHVHFLRIRLEGLPYKEGKSRKRTRSRKQGSNPKRVAGASPA
jgi:hypothetical protein